jgi:integrase
MTRSVIRLTGLNRVRSKGKRYIYDRKTGERLPDEGTPEFFDAYMRLRANPPDKALAGTLGGLIDAYRASPEFQGLSDRTRKDYDNVFDWLKANRSLPLDRLTSKYMLLVRDKAFKARKTRFANYVVQLFSILSNWGRPRGFIEGNPGHRLPKIRRSKSLPRANRPWTPQEQEAVLARCSPTLLPVVALGVFAGLREGDAVVFPWSGYDGTNIRYKQRKSGALVELPAHSRLRAILDAVPKRCPILATTRAGTPWTQNGFRAAFFAMLRDLKAEGAVGEGLTFHGLRHTVGQMLAEAGCDTRTIAAVLGHRSEVMARHYAEAEDSRRRTKDAMQKVTRLERKRHAQLQNSRTRSAKLLNTEGEQ